MPTPNWSAARSGLPGDTTATNASGQANQFLGTHQVNEIYRGSRILAPKGTGGSFSSSPFNAWDKSQPFTMVGTTIGRVQLPIFAYGTGADLIVSLCTDNAGVPGSVITQTRIPASWFTTLGKYTAVMNTSPIQLDPTDSPLATADFNLFTMGGVGFFNYTSGTPVGGGYGNQDPAVISDGSSTIVIIGGMNSANNYVTNVWSITYGGTNVLTNMVPQPTLPIGLGLYSACAITVDPDTGVEYVVITGGATGNSPTYTTIANVYVSQLTGGTGQMSAWSTQTPLPQAMQTASASASGNYVYVVGGVTPSNTVLNTVYWANVQNGQITSWNTGPSLPVGTYLSYVVCINGFLIVAGGFTQPGNTGTTTAVNYAAINSDGSLGPWQVGPPLPVANLAFFGNGNYFTASTDGLIVRGSGTGGTVGLYSLVVDADGPTSVWQTENVAVFEPGALLNNGPGQYYWFGNFVSTSTSYYSSGFVVCPHVSVPLPATGLTNGATYHIVMQQPTGTTDLNNTLINVIDVNMFPGSPNQLLRQRGTTTWIPNTGGIGVPFQVYDLTAGGTPIHTWEDAGSRITTLVYATTPDARPLGVLEATTQPAPPLNSNWQFTTGIAPWTAVNGTPTQSSAHTHGGLPFSLLLTPTGGFTSAYVQSEYLSCTPLLSYTITTWVYSPTGWATVFPNLNFYDASKTFVSSGTSSFSVPANTWTAINGTYTVPATAVFLTMDIGETSSPAAGNLLYVSSPIVSPVLGPQLSSIVEIDYPGTWPTAGIFTPTGTTQLN